MNCSICNSNCEELVVYITLDKYKNIRPMRQHKYYCKTCNNYWATEKQRFINSDQYLKVVSLSGDMG